MVKYRCVKADRMGAVHWDGRKYIEDGIQNARKRAMKMIHGDKISAVLIWLESDFKNRPWSGYKEKIVIFGKNYITHTSKESYVLNPDGSTNTQLSVPFSIRVQIPAGIPSHGHTRYSRER